MSWTFIKVFQYLCDYRGGNSFVSLFFHLFEVQRISVHHAHGQCSVTLTHVSRYFEVYYDSMRHFKDKFFLLTPLNKEAHVKVCSIDT